MSTKIYYAWRMPIGLFNNPFLGTFRAHVLSRATRTCKRLMTNITDQQLKREWKKRRESQFCQLHDGHKLSYKSYQASYAQTDRLRLVFNNLVALSQSNLRDPLCIDCSLNAWVYKGRMYAIAYGEYALHADYKPRPGNGIEEYGYWNNTDRPENLTDREWDRRGKTWDEVCLSGSWDEYRLTHVIVNAKVDRTLLAIAKTIVGKEKAFSALPMFLV